MSPTWVLLAKLFVSVATSVLLLLELELRRSGRAHEGRRARDAALAALGLLGALCWWNLFQFGERGFLHGHEQYHYLLGAKYFRELGYSGLYPCTAVADAHALPPAQLRGRQLRDLETNRLQPIEWALEHPERCTQRFSPSRWLEFQRDVAWFRARLAAQHWRFMILDHGYNAPPAWAIAALPLANWLGVSETSLTLAGLLDPALQLVMWAAVAWAFGWRVLCVALVVWGTNGLREFSFTGGSFLRQDWLCAAVVGLCALRREKHLLGGALLATSALLRIFPALLLGALALRWLLELLRTRSFVPTGAQRRVAAGSLIALALSAPLTGVTSGFESWPAFVRDIRLHQQTPLTNYLGLRTLASYEAANPSPRGDSDAEHERWSVRREQVLREHAVAFAVAALLYLALLGRALVRSPDWAAAALGLGLVFVFLELTAYYYSLLIALALLHERDPAIGPLACAFAAVSLLVTTFAARSDPATLHMLLGAALALLLYAVTWRLGRAAPPPARELQPAAG